MSTIPIYRLDQINDAMEAMLAFRSQRSPRTTFFPACPSERPSRTTLKTAHFYHPHIFLKGRAMRSFDTAVSRTSDQHTANGRALLSVGFALLVVRACGVVYGDIGTSVLYTLREIFFGVHTWPGADHAGHYLGRVSLIFWALLLLITIKYVGFVLYADDHGEGGVFALLGLLNGMKYLGAGLVTGMLLLPAGLLYGDGLITPAISILSAVEGLEYMTEQFQPYVIWIAAGIVLALFAVQRTGTARVGFWFGWCTVLWLITIGLCGAVLVWRHPQILLAVNPVYGFPWAELGWAHSLVVLGFVMLAVTGGSHVCGHGTLWSSAHSGGLAGARLPVPPAQLRWTRRLPARAPRGRKHPAQPVACLLRDLQCRGARDGTARPDGESGDHGDHYREPGADLRCLFAHSAGHCAGLWRTDGHYPHEHRTCGADLYADAQLAALCRVFDADLYLSVQLAPGLGLWPGRLRRDALDLPGDDSAGRPALALECVASLLFGGFAGLEGMFLLANTLKFLEGGFVPLGWPGPLCVYNYTGVGMPCWPRRMPGLRPSETCAGSSP